MNTIVYDNFTRETLKGFKVKEIKDFIKEKELIKPRGLTRKQHFIDFLVQERDVVFGLKEQEIIIPPLKRLAEPKTTIFSQDEIVVGIDEAGQGCCAGDLYIGLAILPKHDDDPRWDYINDSKKLSKSRKDLLFDYVKEIAIEYVIHRVTIKEIDELNIFQAKMKGFHDAIDKLKTKIDHVLVDGPYFRDYENKDGFKISHDCVVRGDGIYKSIAAASILAKVQRDRDMKELAKDFPEFKWDENKGYCTNEHIGIIKKYGVSKWHRRTYTVCKEWETIGLYGEKKIN